MKKILWIAPNLNHYKSRFINRLAENDDLEITVLAGAQMEKQGHRTEKGKSLFLKSTVQASKENFQLHFPVYIKLFQVVKINKFDFVLMPVEKKIFLVIFFLFFLKKIFGYKLISYSHPVTRNSIFGPNADKCITKFLFRLFDRVIFYTKDAKDWAVASKVIPQNKAFFANNTLDTKKIWENYNFEINKSDQKVILFIGRIVANKRLDLLLKYHGELKKNLPSIRLIVIGDGPEANRLKLIAKSDQSVCWEGAIVDEPEIAQYMRSAHLVLVPGWSGLSIVHAFCYGKPYATIVGPHPPEIAYLKDGQNGLILSGDLKNDCDRILKLLTDKKTYESMCIAAFTAAEELSIEKWCHQMKKAIS